MGATGKNDYGAKKTNMNKKKIMAEMIQRRLKGDSFDTLKNWLIDVHGLSVRNVNYYLTELTDNISSLYIKTASKDDKKRLADNPSDVNEMIARLDSLYQTANEITRLSILKEISELKGLKKKNIDLTSGGEPIKITINKSTPKDDKKES